MKGGCLVHHRHSSLEESELVMITFEYQKNDKRDQQVHMFKTSDDVLNPVKAWARTVQRVRSYQGASDESKVCEFHHKQEGCMDIQADHVRAKLCAVVELIGEEVLGFTKEDIGLHSIRSGGAMAMFLSGTSTIVIKKVGRWSSEAFLEYIREQVEDFTAGVAQKMIAFEEFNNLQPSSEPKVETQTLQDKENGLDLVPHGIKFSELALGGSKGRETCGNEDREMAVENLGGGGELL